MLDTLLIIGVDGGGTETSIILSAIIASSCRVRLGCGWGRGKYHPHIAWSLRNGWVLSGVWSPNSCFMQRKSYDAFLSPSSSPVTSCCKQCCSEASVCLIRAALRVLY